jgi:hypothetical protein
MFVLTLPIISPAQIWVVRYNGPGDSADAASAIAVDNAGNIYVTGESVGSGTDSDYATVKYDASGMEKWVARYNGTDNGADWANAITLDNSGNIYITGASVGSGIYEDYATVKYDASGVEQWVARYNGPGNSYDAACATAVDNMGSVYVTGSSWGSGTFYDYATVKYSSLGVEQWVARYDGPVSRIDQARAIAVDGACNVYVTGESEGSGTFYDYATVKYDSSGVEQWVVRYNGPGNYFDEARAIALDNSGNIYVTGYSSGSGTFADYATVKYDSLGVEQWVARYHGPGNVWDLATAITLDNVGNIYVTGESVGSGTQEDYATVKYNSLGVEQWVARYDGPVSGNDRVRAIAVDGACNVYVTGESEGSGTFYDYATVKYDASGVEQWAARYNGPGNSYDAACATAVDNMGSIYVAGSSWGSGTGYDYATIKYSLTGIEENRLTVRKQDDMITATICRGILQLPASKTCKVFDIMGRIVEPGKIQTGIYFVEVDGVVTQRVVKVR